MNAKRDVRIVGPVVDAATETDIEERYQSGIFMRYITASNAKNRMKDTGESVVDPGAYEALKLELLECECALLSGVLKSYFIANRLDAMRETLYQNNNALNTDDILILSLIENVGIKAGVINALTTAPGITVRIASPIKRLKHNADFFIGNTPILCKKLPKKHGTGIKYVYLGSENEVSPIALALPMKYTREIPLKYQEALLECQELNKADPLLIMAQYTMYSGFMRRNYNDPVYANL